MMRIFQRRKLQRPTKKKRREDWRLALRLYICITFPLMSSICLKLADDAQGVKGEHQPS